MENMKKTPQNNCEEIRNKLRSYAFGCLSDKEVLEVDEHLKQCKSCAKLLEENENEVFFHKNEKLDLPDVHKIESKFTRKIVGKVLTIILMIVISFYAVICLFLPIAFNKINMKKSEELGYALKDLIQLGIPGANLKGGNEGTTSVFKMIKNIEYNQKTADGGLKTGVFTLSVPLYAGRNNWNISSVDNVQGMGYVFFYPQFRGSNSLDTVWRKLTKIGDGTKTTAAIYFEKPITTVDMKRILDKIQAFGLDTWFALDTGDAIKWKYPMAKLYKELEMFSPQWGFPMRMNPTPTIADNITNDKNGIVTSMSVGFAEHDVTAVGVQFKKEMKAFEGYSEKYFEAPEFTADLKNLNKFIALHGINLRGAIVEASTANILKLKDEPNIARIDIIDVGFDY